MKLSKKFVLSLSLILVANSLFAQTERIDNKDVKECMIDNQTSDVKKALTEKFGDYFITNYLMYFDKGFLLNNQIYIFDKKVKNPIDKRDYVFCNPIKSKDSIKLSEDVTSLMFEYYHLNSQLIELPNYKNKFKTNPFELRDRDINKVSLLKLNQLIFETISLLKFNDNKEM
jgi:hypothetical protein